MVNIVRFKPIYHVEAMPTSKCPPHQLLIMVQGLLPPAMEEPRVFECLISSVEDLKSDITDSSTVTGGEGSAIARVVKQILR